jgi:antirestriction protein ArdC
MKKSIYERVTHQVMENLKTAGSWQQLWNFSCPISLNDRMYTGINHLLLSSSGFSSPVWGTFNQVRQNGGSINRGEKSSIVVFWKKLQSINVNPDTGKPVTENHFILRYYNVFNSQQCTFDEIGQDKIKRLSGISESASNVRNTQADQLIENMPDKPAILHGNYNPCYVPSQDEIRMPDIEKFKSSEAYYSAMYHEAIHSTGAKHRLDRIKADHFSNEHAYSREELVAELGSAFLCNIAGIKHDVENTAAYLKSWLSALENNPSWITWAATRAQKACEYIIPATASSEKAAA